MAHSKPRVVVGLDFGTAYSGFAFAHVSEPDMVYSFYEYPDSRRWCKMYCKTLTASYYKNVGGAWQFESWGYPARTQFRNDIQACRLQRARGPSDDPLQPSVGTYVTRFKLHLASRDMGPSSAESLPRGLTLDVVISDYLRGMGYLIVESIRMHYGLSLTKELIQWCVTVPSIWGNDAKAMMETCMTAAGLVNGTDGSPYPPIIVLEPEAASFHCYKVMSEQILRVGDKLLVADIGGGTSDVVVHEVVTVGKGSYRVKEATASSGGLCGGTYVDDRFMDFLHRKIGPCCQDCITEYPTTYMQLLQNWEFSKQSFDSPEGIVFDIDISLPNKLSSAWEEYDERMGIPARFDYSELEISYQEMVGIFDPVVEECMRLISRQLAEVGTVKVLIVVGGFAGSPYLMACIRKRFGGIVPQIISPFNPGSSVCQGAVMLALNWLRWTTFVNDTDSKIQIEYNGDVHILHPNSAGYVRWFTYDLLKATSLPKISLTGVELLYNISLDDLYGNNGIIVYRAGVGSACSFQMLRESLKETMSSMKEFLLRMENILNKVKIWRNQCEHLLKKYQGGVQIMERELGKEGHLEVENPPALVKDICSKFIYCMLEGEALLLFCSGSDNFNYQAVFALSSPPPSVPTFSRFAVVLRELDWILDFCCFLGQYLCGKSSFDDWEWCEKRCRLVYNNQRVVPMKSGFMEDESLEADGSRQLADRKELCASVNSKSNWFWTGDKFQDKLEAIWKKRLLPSSHSPGLDSVPDCFWIENPVDFQYVEHLGGGASKVVNKSKWLGETVAVAMVTDFEHLRKILIAEAGILARVQHPNVVELMGCAYKDDDLNHSAKGFIVTELMEQDLESLIRVQRRNFGDGAGSPFALQVAVDIVLQIVEAMIHLKECRVIHRDLKPNNCLASARYQKYSWPGYNLMYYRIKLTDFGTSNMRGQDSYFVTKKLGTPSYMAPELYGRPEEEWPYTWSADVYSFGMTSYKIFTGRDPFETSRFRDISTIICEGKRPLFPSEFPLVLRGVIEKCWAQDPLARPTFQDIRRDLWLFKILQGMPFDIRDKICERKARCLAKTSDVQLGPTFIPTRKSFRESKSRGESHCQSPTHGTLGVFQRISCCGGHRSPTRVVVSER